jgi:hypothetical protein
MESTLSPYQISTALKVRCLSRKKPTNTLRIWQLLYASDLLYVPTIFTAQLAVSLFFMRLSGPERSFFHRLARFAAGASIFATVVCFLSVSIRLENGLRAWEIVIVGHKSMVSY